MSFLVYFLFFMSLIGHSFGLYCVCKDGVSNKRLQEAIDYACGHGADCEPILKKGPCFKPNKKKDHCNYAVNSYYQKMNNAPGTCDFAGAATTTQTPPTDIPSGCVYPSSPCGGSTISPPSPTGGGGIGRGTVGPSGSGTESSAGVSYKKNTNTILLFSIVVYFVFFSL